MKERNPFEQKPGGTGIGPLGRSESPACEQWEILLAEALDGLLPVEERSAFEAHGSECPVCAELLKQAQQGREWLHFLEDEPEIPAGMVERILSKTSGVVVSEGPLAIGSGGTAHIPAHLLGVPLRRSTWDSRMMMTVAMAFFSIALTLNVALNLAGVRLTSLKLSDLTPASMELNLSHQFWNAQKSLTQYYDNLRMVYEVESKMRDLRRNEEMRRSAPPQQPQAVPANPRGNKNGGKLEPSARVPQAGALWGTPEMASAEIESSEQEERKISGDEVGSVAVLCERVQAERSLT